MVDKAEPLQKTVLDQQPVFYDAEGTIHDWLRREAAVDRLTDSITTGKRARTDSSASTDFVSRPLDSDFHAARINDIEEQLCVEPLEAEYLVVNPPHSYIDFGT